MSQTAKQSKMASRWFSAHVVMYIKFLDGEQDVYSVQENVHLVQAATGDDAWLKAEQIGREAEFPEGWSVPSGRSASLVFAGVRKLIAADVPWKRPGDGSEVTYSEYLVQDEAAIQRLVRNENVEVNYIGNDYTDPNHIPRFIPD